MTSFIENSKDMTAKIPSHKTNEEFIKYLDSEFKSEINLLNDDNTLFVASKPLDAPKSEDSLNTSVKLDFRGHKNMFPKGKNAERRDVLYKNFIRATRRYLWEMFEKDFDVSLMPIGKPSDLYQQNVEKFYK